jgi:hypothetical protein
MIAAPRAIAVTKAPTSPFSVDVSPLHALTLNHAIPV